MFIGKNFAYPTLSQFSYVKNKKNSAVKLQREKILQVRAAVLEKAETMIETIVNMFVA